MQALIQKCFLFIVFFPRQKKRLFMRTVQLAVFTVLPALAV